MKIFTLLLFLLASINALANTTSSKHRSPASTKYKVHRCEATALASANLLLPFYLASEAGVKYEYGDVLLKGTIKSPNGKMKYDVLEVFGFVYKAEYRMRFIFANIGEDCLLMGQEILDMSSL